MATYCSEIGRTEEKMFRNRNLKLNESLNKAFGLKDNTFKMLCEAEKPAFKEWTVEELDALPPGTKLIFNKGYSGRPDKRAMLTKVKTPHANFLGQEMDWIDHTQEWFTSTGIVKQLQYKGRKFAVVSEESQLDKGEEVEAEHDNTIKAIEKEPEVKLPKARKMIAQDHIDEFPKYYDALENMENNLKKKDSLKEIKLPKSLLDKAVNLARLYIGS
jgi:hypothetical protein